MPVPEPLRPPDTSIEPGRPVERFAARTAGMTASEIRALFAVASRPEVVSLAGGMPNLAALPLDALAAEVAELVARDGQVALQYGSAQGIPAAARADLRGDGAGGDPGRPGRRRRHRRLADGAGPGHPHLLRPGRRGPRRGAVLRRRAGQLRGLPGAGRARRDGRRRAGPRAAARGAARVAARGRRRQVPVHDPELPQSGRRDAGRRAARGGARDLRGVRRGRRSRTTRTGCSASPGRSTRRCGRWTATSIYLGSFSKTFASGPAGRLGAGAAGGAGPAGAGRRVGHAVPADVQPDAGVPVPRRARLAQPGQDLHRGLPRASGRDARARWRPPARRVARGTSRTAGSTCG